MRLDPPPPGWYRPLAAHLGEAYLKYSFTYGTKNEVDFLMQALSLRPGMRLLDVGSGPGRHSVEFAKRGLEVVAVDISAEFIAIAKRRAGDEEASLSAFEMDASSMPFEDEFDAVVSICEGAFGLGGDDLAVLRRISRALRPEGRVAVGAPNVFYVLRHMAEEGEFDPARMLFRERVEVIGGDGEKRNFEMWNSCYTPREMEWIANGAGLGTSGIYGVSPGDYREQPPSLDHPELLLVGWKPLA